MCESKAVDFQCCTDRKCFFGCNPVLRDILVYFKTLKGIRYSWKEKEKPGEDELLYDSDPREVKKEITYDVKIVTLKFMSEGIEVDKMRYVPSVLKSTKGTLENALIFIASGGVALEQNYKETGVLFGWEGNPRLQGALKDACKILRDRRIDEIRIEVKLSCPFFNRNKCSGKPPPKVLIEELEWNPHLPKNLSTGWEISRDYKKLTKYISVRAASKDGEEQEKRTGGCPSQEDKIPQGYLTEDQAFQVFLRFLAQFED